jgi:hypothetical protein
MAALAADQVAAEEVVVVEGPGGSEGQLAEALAALAVLALPCLGLRISGPVWQVTVGADDCALFAGIAGDEDKAMGMVHKFHDVAKESWGGGGWGEEGEEGGAAEHDVPVEGDGVCSACGVSWSVTSHQLLTAPPP